MAARIKAAMAAKFAAQGGGTPRPGTPTSTPTPTPGTPAPTDFTGTHMRPTGGFRFPQYSQQWAMNPDIFGRTYP
jgi:hypothetical protein